MSDIVDHLLTSSCPWCSDARREIERLQAQLKTAVWADSEECRMLTDENEKLRAQLGPCGGDPSRCGRETCKCFLEQTIAQLQRELKEALSQELRYREIATEEIAQMRAEIAKLREALADREEDLQQAELSLRIMKEDRDMLRKLKDR
jgi:regulator of replication initiation timing